jgi:poly(A) polymerase Pap1
MKKYCSKKVLVATTIAIVCGIMVAIPSCKKKETKYNCSCTASSIAAESVTDKSAYKQKCEAASVQGSIARNAGYGKATCDGQEI